MDGAAFVALALACAPQVDPATTRALVEVESSFNPHAIGVVGGVLARQPAHRTEALATTRALQASGWNFSVGLAQINVHTARRLGLSLDQAFEPCTNLAAMQAVLVECQQRATTAADPDRQRSGQAALRATLSCYYSGNFVTGFDHGYVRRVATAVARIAQFPLRPRSPHESF